MTGEASGAMMNIMANALVYDEKYIPAEVKDFLYSIEPDRSVWEKHYITGEWDSIKWILGGEDGTILHNESLLHIMRLALMTVCACPQTSYEAIRENFRVVWQVVGKPQWLPWIYIETNSYGIIPEPNFLCKSIVTHVTDFCENSPISIFVWNIGLLFCLLLILTIRAYKSMRYKVQILVLPIAIYNLCTMLLLSGPTFRYFHYTVVLFLPLAFFLYCAGTRNSKSKNP